MRRPITTIADLRRVLRGIYLGRPGDRYPRIEHAPTVDRVVPVIAGNILMVADNHSIEVSQKLHNGQYRDINMVYFKVGGRQKFLCYEGRTKTIEFRDGHRGGKAQA